MYRRVHPWVTGQAHSEGSQEGSERWNNTKGMHMFNIYFHDFHTVQYMLYHLRIARIFIPGNGFWQWLEN
jgi:hypothetical protein